MDLKESKQVNWEAIKKYCKSSSIKDDPILASSSSSFSSSSLSDVVDDALSSSTSSNSSRRPSSGPLYELADLMAQLPIKRRRGLSKFYNGKSQSFTSLSNVKNFEDLAKKEMMSCSRRIKSCKSYGGNLNHHHKLAPKAVYHNKEVSQSIMFTFFWY